MKFMNVILWIGISVLFLLACSGGQTSGSWQVSSPNGLIKMELDLAKPGDTQETSLTFRVLYIDNGENVELVRPSPIGLVREDEKFDRNLRFLGSSSELIDETYTLLHGKQLQNHNHANQITLNFENDRGAKLDLILRAYDDGVAFRYRFPEQENDVVTMAAELTGFNMPLEGKAFTLPHDSATMYTPAYENYFQNGIEIGTSSPTESGWSFPALFDLYDEHYWVLLTESDLDRQYCGTRLHSDAANGLYRIRFPDTEEGEGRGNVQPSSDLPWTLPWRVIIVGDSAADIAESNLVNHVSSPSKVKDTDWIKPGRVSWSWWSASDSPKDPEALRSFIDLAEEMKWEYSLIDANWNEMGDEVIKELVEYGKKRDVGILLWYNSGGPHNIVTEAPRDRMMGKERRRKEMAWLHDLGVKGIKVDFFQSDKQNIIAHYLDILEDAAEFELMINFHGCTLPRGWTRTYPHLMTMEAVRGGESYKFAPEYPERAPWHNTILPFARNTVGPMDYTPVTFSDVTYPHLTTHAHELALAVAFESGLQHFADKVDAYLKAPSLVKTFLSQVPVIWQETRVLAGYPGKQVVIARRLGDEWYVAGLNGLDQVINVEIDFSFLGSGSYKGIWIGDGPSDREFAIEEIAAEPGQQMPVRMQAYGGFVMQLEKD